MKQYRNSKNSSTTYDRGRHNTNCEIFKTIKNSVIMDSDHNYRLKNKDGWTKKEFQKIFPHSKLLWPSNTFGGRGSPTHLTRLHVEVRTPYDGIILEGIINKLGRKGIAQFKDAEYTANLSREERSDFGKNLTEMMPDRVTLDLSTDKLSELKEIIENLQNAKDKIQEFTEIKGIGTKRILFQLRHTGLTLGANRIIGGHFGDKLSDLYDKKNVMPIFGKYKEFVDPEYLTQDLDRVSRTFAVAVVGDFIGLYIHNKIEDYRKKKKLQKGNDESNKMG